MLHLEPLSRCISVEGNIACQGDIVGGACLLVPHHHVPSSHCGGLLRYDISELWETGRGVEMQAVEAAERNQSVSLCRVKTWPQLMCCAIV